MPILPESNLLPGFSARSPEEPPLNRSRHVGAVLLSGLTPDFVAADLLAAAAINTPSTRAQLCLLRAVAMSMRVNFINASGAGATRAEAMTALYRLATHRN